MGGDFSVKRSQTQMSPSLFLRSMKPGSGLGVGVLLDVSLVSDEDFLEVGTESSSFLQQNPQHLIGS